jgi:glyoxylase-like metal-dependent hydrolase (beta-lactamase superfamily II)
MSLLGDHNRLLTGDCLLIGSCGRTDFQNGSTQDMYESLQKLLLLPPDTLVYPGHDYHKRFVSTLREEKENNPQLQHKSFAHFEGFGVLEFGSSKENQAVGSGKFAGWFKA